MCCDCDCRRTYDYMRRVGLKNYLTDRRFTADKCSFEIYGYPQNYGSAVNQNTGSQSQTQCSNCYLPQYQNAYPCNTALCANSNTGGGTTCPNYCTDPQYANMQQCMQCNTNTNNCPEYCKQQQYANQQACLQCNGGGTGQCPSNYISYCSNPANANVSPCNTYPCNMLNGMNTGSQSTSTYDLGFCGTTAVACDFTVFVPNSSAIDYFSVSNNGYKVMRDTPRFQWVSPSFWLNIVDCCPTVSSSCLSLVSCTAVNSFTCPGKIS